MLPLFEGIAAEKWMKSDPRTESVTAGVRMSRITVSMTMFALAGGGRQRRMVWLIV